MNETNPKPKKLDYDDVKKTVGRFKVHEKAFVSDNYLLMTDEEIADKLGRTKEAIMRLRKKMGLSKQGLTHEEKIRMAGSTESATEQLGTNDKVKAAISDLKNSKFYEWVESELVEDEREVYIREFSDQVAQLDGIKPAELYTLHMMLMERIKMHRIAVVMAKNARMVKSGGDEAMLMNFQKEYDNSSKAFLEIQKSLKLDRERRKDISKNDLDFIGILKRITDQKNKEAMGVEASEMSLAAIQFRKGIDDSVISGDQFEEEEK